MGNLFDVKLRAIENMHEAGIEIILVITIVNNVNNDQVGPIVNFARENPKKIAFVAFQPVSFTGRDEDITPQRRMRQRYTLSHLAGDVKKQTRHYRTHARLVPHLDVQRLRRLRGSGERSRGAVGHGELRMPPELRRGHRADDQQGNQGMGAGAGVPERPRAGAGYSEDHRRGRAGRSSPTSCWPWRILKNYKPFKAPKSLALMDLIKKFDKSFALSGEKKTREKYGASDPNRTLEDAMKRRSDPWNLLFIAGMWFQDLFNYDFRRTEMCIIPYATQLGEISFCAYNTGIGWRKIIENMYKNASVAEWYKTHGKHAIYAKGKSVELDTTQHSLTVNAEDAARVRSLEHDVPLTAAEEEKARRKAAWEAQQATQARKVYEEIVLQKSPSELVQIGGAAKPEEEKVAV